MTKMTDVRPIYYMPDEKRAFARGWRHGNAGLPAGRSKLPHAYARGYNEGLANRPDPRISQEI
jgi:ribosome modulation factor